MNAEDYTLESIEPSDPPGDMAGTNWQCYIIQQGDNRICGYRQGNTDAVQRAVENIVERLNERRKGKRGRVHLTMTPFGKKASPR